MKIYWIQIQHISINPNYKNHFFSVLIYKFNWNKNGSKLSFTNKNSSKNFPNIKKLYSKKKIALPSQKPRLVRFCMNLNRNERARGRTIETSFTANIIRSVASSSICCVIYEPISSACRTIIKRWNEETALAKVAGIRRVDHKCIAVSFWLCNVSAWFIVEFLCFFYGRYG